MKKKIFNEKLIVERLTECFEKVEELSAEKRYDIVFHMTDWLDDLAHLTEVFQNIEKYNSDQIEKAVMAFLIHVPAHVNAATKLYLGFGVENVFELENFYIDDDELEEDPEDSKDE